MMDSVTDVTEAPIYTVHARVTGITGLSVTSVTALKLRAEGRATEVRARGLSREDGNEQSLDLAPGALDRRCALPTTAISDRGDGGPKSSRSAPCGPWRGTTHTPAK